MPASLSFLAPAWAAALPAAVALPLLVHLLSRRARPPRRTFPAARFVQQAVAATTRRHRPRHILLMLLRMAALLAIVLAFMQPTWRAANQGSARVATSGNLPGPGAGVHVGIVLDRTASMQRPTGGESLFDRARQDAINLLGSLDPSRHRASIILLDRAPRPLLAEPTADFAALVDQLARLAPTHEHGQLGEALHQLRVVHERAARRAGPAALPAPLHVHVFTDAQQTQMTGSRAAAPAADDWQWHVHAAEEPNLALAHVRTRPGAPVAHQPATVSAALHNHSDHPRTAAVSLRVDGHALATRSVSVGAFEQAAVSFDVTFLQPGSSVVELALVDAHADALPQDDVAGRVVRVRAAQLVHLITQSDADDPASAAYFLTRAIQPAVGDGDESSVALNVHPPAALPALIAQSDDAAPAVFVLVEAGLLDAAQRDALAALVRSGRSLLWIIDTAPAAAALSAWSTQHAAPLLPDAAQPWRDAPAHSLTLEAGRFDDPILAVFEGSARAALLRTAFSQHMHSRPAPGARVLLRFADGSPALAVASLGRARVAVWAGSLSPQQSDFVRSPLLVPWAHQLLRHLAPAAPQPRNPHPGERLPWADERATQPGLEARRDRESGALRRGVWVEIDPTESDLTPATDEQRDAMAQAVSTRAVSAVQRASTIATLPGPDAPQAHALWPWLVMLAVGMLAVESLVLLAAAHRAGR